MAVVPNVIGLSTSGASAAIVGAGLVVGVVSSYADETGTETETAGGIVLNQIPSGGTVVAGGSSVDLVVSAAVIIEVKVKPVKEKTGRRKRAALKRPFIKQLETAAERNERKRKKQGIRRRRATAGFMTESVADHRRRKLEGATIV